eukprot:CAMPEP_0175819082 /NCGR_PEP_ID=MMETSP0107_2-20121207/7885_1 /TAXON_ID=195067 ORGANISM="Goniomonas pacifica, Strain CCMP1869" /NCGR_SAMPLE_ID=MMETSP0107_2 /ASSEMBLY_ACC=CAM_ASM_000203 /LENGTH=48 /DNA_ID= /DNA_START= /DNA_END= /DNA_ORIENTATION=
MNDKRRKTAVGDVGAEADVDLCELETPLAQNLQSKRREQDAAIKKEHG